MKNIKPTTIIIFYLTIIFISCNKKSVAPAASGTNSSTIQTGLIDLVKLQYFDGTNIVTSVESVSMSFFNYSNNSSTVISAGNVSFNGTGLKYNGNSYEDTTYAINFNVPTYTINTEGSNQLTAFTVTINPSYPIFTGDALLPTTVSQSSGFTINLGSSISNISDTATIELSTSAIKKIAPGQTSVTFTPADISGILVSNGHTFQIELSNTLPININGNTFYVKNRVLYTKNNINLIP